MTNIHDAKTHLSKLLERVAAGEEIVIARAGKPVARLVPYLQPPKPIRKPGSLKGKIRIKAGFESVDPEIEKMFYGDAD